MGSAVAQDGPPLSHEALTTKTSQVVVFGQTKVEPGTSVAAEESGRARVVFRILVALNGANISNPGIANALLITDTLFNTISAERCIIAVITPAADDDAQTRSRRADAAFCTRLFIYATISLTLAAVR